MTKINLKISKNKNHKPVGFIGQGWIGKNYADNFEDRGYNIVRYSLEEPHIRNRDKIKECEIVFVAVPTPSTPKGFDSSILREAVKSAGTNAIVVIKSTLLPGTTESVQEDNPSKYIMHSPEFLREATAARDAASPKRNIIGIPVNTPAYQKRAKLVMDILPPAGYKTIIPAREAELIKYGGNCLLAIKVLFNNMLYDVADKLGCDWDAISEAMGKDSRLGDSHWRPMHASNPKRKPGRGAGGHCFIKDFNAFIELYRKYVGDERGLDALTALEKKNIDLLLKSGKDLDLLRGIFGDKYSTGL